MTLLYSIIKDTFRRQGGICLPGNRIAPLRCYLYIIDFDTGPKPKINTDIKLVLPLFNILSKCNPDYAGIICQPIIHIIMPAYLTQTY